MRCCHTSSNQIKSGKNHSLLLMLFCNLVFFVCTDKQPELSEESVSNGATASISLTKLGGTDSENAEQILEPAEGDGECKSVFGMTSCQS